MKKFISYFILFLFLIFCGCKKSLSRDDAKQAIIQKERLPSFETRSFERYYIVGRKSVWPNGEQRSFQYNTDVLWSDLRFRFEKLINEGNLMETHSGTTEKGFGGLQGADIVSETVILNPTKKTSDLCIVSNNMMDKNITFKTCNLVFGEVTGIQEIEKQAIVHYTLLRENFTPFAENQNTQPIKKTAEFSLYDDGWRINGDASASVRYQPSAEEKAAAEKAVQDSIAAAQQAQQAVEQQQRMQNQGH